MKYTKTTLLALAAALGLAGAAHGQTTFVFDDGSSTGAAGLALEAFADNTDDASFGVRTSGTYTQDGITLSAGTDFGKFNLTNSGFGPNDVGTGDETDNFDGSESMIFSFDTAGTFDSVDFALLDDSPETAILSFANGNTFNLRDGATSDISVSGNDVFDNIAESFNADELITLSITGGNGWTLESFTITASAVPEPSSFALIAGIFGLTSVMLRRRRA